MTRQASSPFTLALTLALICPTATPALSQSVTTLKSNSDQDPRLALRVLGGVSLAYATDSLFASESIVGGSPYTEDIVWHAGTALQYRFCYRGTVSVGLQVSGGDWRGGIVNHINAPIAIKWSLGKARFRDGELRTGKGVAPVNATQLNGPQIGAGLVFRSPKLPIYLKDVGVGIARDGRDGAGGGKAWVAYPNNLRLSIDFGFRTKSQFYYGLYWRQDLTPTASLLEFGQGNGGPADDIQFYELGIEASFSLFSFGRT